MKGIGFYARMMAIIWLFGLVIGNFGEGWLAPDNVILTRTEKPQPPKPLEQVAAEALPRAEIIPSSADIGVRRKERILYSAGWGGADSDPTGDDADDTSDYGFDQFEEDLSADWGAD